MKKEQFITTFAAALVVCLLIAGYAAMTATYSAAEAPPVPSDYVSAVLMHDDAAKPSVDTETLSGKLQQMQSAIGSGISDTVSAFATDESYASNIAESCGMDITDWKAVDLSGGEKVYLAQGTKLVLRKGSATCIESASVGLTDCGISRTLEQGDELSVGILYEATVPAAGFFAANACTAIFSGDYSLG